MTSLVVGWLAVGYHAGALWPNGASYAYSYGTLIGNPTPGIQWYNFRPPGVTPNRGNGEWAPVRRFLSNYFDLLLLLLFCIPLRKTVSTVDHTTLWLKKRIFLGPPMSNRDLSFVGPYWREPAARIESLCGATGLLCLHMDHIIRCWRRRCWVIFSDFLLIE